MRKTRWLRWPLIAIGVILAYGPIILDLLQLRTFNIPPLVWMAFGTTILMIIAGVWIYGLTRENNDLLTSIAPILGIEFDRSAPMPLEERSDWSAEGSKETRLYRISVRNRSQLASIDEVRVSLVSVKPAPYRFRPLILREMNDRSGEESSRGFTLHPGEARLIDVVEGFGGLFDDVEICHVRSQSDESLLRHEIPKGRHELTIAAEGRNVPQTRVVFVMDSDAEGKLIFEHLH